MPHYPRTMNFHLYVILNHFFFQVFLYEILCLVALTIHLVLLTQPLLRTMVWLFTLLKVTDIALALIWMDLSFTLFQFILPLSPLNTTSSF